MSWQLQSLSHKGRPTLFLSTTLKKLVTLSTLEPLTYAATARRA
jgi:hypothetical protein